MRKPVTLVELIYRSAGRLQDAFEELKRRTFTKQPRSPFLEHFLLKESSILVRLSVKYWLHIRLASIKRKLSRK
jgi:hypothetical protein